MDIDLFECDFISSLDITEEISFSACYEHDSLTFGTCTTGTTDSVDVCLWIFWYIVVYNEHDVLHIESTSRNISGDEDITESILEAFEGTGSVSLLHISMETSSRESVTFEHIGDIPCFMFHPAEYDNLDSCMILDVLLEHLILLKVRNFDKGMVDFGNHEVFCCLDSLVSFSYVFCEEIIHFLRNSCREGHGLLYIGKT